MRILLKYVYKIIVVAAYTMLVMNGTYFLCSQLAPIQAMEKYMNLEWLLPKVMSEIQGIGALSGLFLNLFDAASTSGTYVGFDVLKEIFFALIVVAFFKLGTLAYGGLSTLAEKMFGKRERQSWIIDGVCTFFLIITSVTFSSIVMDTVFYHMMGKSYAALAIVAAAVLVVLCIAAHICNCKIRAETGGVIKSFQGKVGFIGDLVVQIFGILLIYTTVSIYTELVYMQHGIAAYLFLVLLLILCIGICTALFVYYTYGFLGRKQE